MDNQPPEQNPEEGTKTGIPEAHHRTPVFSKGLKSADPLHRGPGHGRKEACLIGWEEKEPAHRSFDSRQRSPQAKRTEVEARRRQQKGTPSRTTSQYSESEGGHWKSKSRRQRSNTYEDDLSQPWTWKLCTSQGQRKASFIMVTQKEEQNRIFKKASKTKQRTGRKQIDSNPSTKMPKEFFALEKGKVSKAPPPMGKGVRKGYNPLTILDDPYHGKKWRSQDYPKLLSGDGNVLSTPEGRRRDGGPNDHRSEMADILCIAGYIFDGGHPQKSCMNIAS
ncbi:hypothetical protein Tco_0629725 [Tanacetum coccineum]|uniref:Uncharacterized protein n=1 Tax=Tanacetum coccineum TaxID=301880 RepID=A0ABQ4WU87_9ASTR